MAENYISQFYTWVTGNTITATRLNGNISNVVDGLSGGAKTINVGKIMVANVEIVSSIRAATLTAVTVDNLLIDGNTISSSSGNVALTPVAGAAVVVDSHWSFDGTGLTALTDADTVITAYTGKNITIESVTFDGGVVAGISSLTATAITGTLATAAQGNVTSLGTLTILNVDNIQIDGNTISATSGAVTLSNGSIATTQTAGDNSTKLATTAYVDAAVLIENLWDRATTTVSLHTAGDTLRLNTTEKIEFRDTALYMSSKNDGYLDFDADTGFRFNTSVVAGTFSGNITGNVTGNCSGTAATVTGATQASITTCANLTTVGTVGTGVWQGTTIKANYLQQAAADLGAANITVDLSNSNGSYVTNFTIDGTFTGTFSGNLTGNVTGNCSGTAATVTGAAQTAITSVGTLTSLIVGSTTTIGVPLVSYANASLLRICKPFDGSAPVAAFINSQPFSAGSTNETADLLMTWRDSGEGEANGVIIRAGKEGDYSSVPNSKGYLAFMVPTANVTTEYMRIGSNGFVGIGSTNPLVKLDVQLGATTSSADYQYGLRIHRPHAYSGSAEALFSIGRYAAGDPAATNAHSALQIGLAEDGVTVNTVLTLRGDLTTEVSGNILNSNTGNSITAFEIWNTTGNTGIAMFTQAGVANLAAVNTATPSTWSAYTPLQLNGSTYTFTGTGLMSHGGALSVTGNIYTTAWTDYSATSTVTGFEAGVSKQIAYKVVGKLVYVWYYIEGTSNDTILYFTLPYAQKNSIATLYASDGIAYDAGARLSSPSCIHMAANSASVVVQKALGTAAWTNSGIKISGGSFVYETN